MEYPYAALILNETNKEINEDNLTAVLDAAGASVRESRVKALVAALEEVDIDEERITEPGEGDLHSERVDEEPVESADERDAGSAGETEEMTTTKPAGRE